MWHLKEVLIVSWGTVPYNAYLRCTQVRHLCYSDNVVATSPRVKGSKTVLDSGFHAVDSGFQVLDSIPVFVSGNWIPECSNR